MRVCGAEGHRKGGQSGPLTNSLFHWRPTQTRRPHSKLDAAYRKADRSLDQIIQLLAA